MLIESANSYETTTATTFLFVYLFSNGMENPQYKNISVLPRINKSLDELKILDKLVTKI